jgi:adsorption protein B
LAVFDALIEGRAIVQLPVLPLIRRGSLVSGHYADEFAYAHSVPQPVRAMLGAAMPLAGTGCAIATNMLATIAAERGGAPFDASSLTEDYELGLHVAARGGVACFARIRDPEDGSLVAVCSATKIRDIKSAISVCRGPATPDAPTSAAYDCFSFSTVRATP